MEVLFERDDYRVTLLTFDADREEIEEVITFFEAIASERSWQPKDQLRAYPLSSKYFALRVGNVLAGALQFVVGGVTIEGLPCLAVWPELQLQHQNEVADIALLALRKDYRGQRKLFWLLCTEMWRYCVRHNICELWVEATPRVVKIYQEVFGWPLQIEGPLRLQWDEYCYPCKMSVDVIGEVIRARSQKLQTYKQIWEHACS